MLHCIFDSNVKRFVHKCFFLQFSLSLFIFIVLYILTCIQHNASVHGLPPFLRDSFVNVFHIIIFAFRLRKSFIFFQKQAKINTHTHTYTYRCPTLESTDNTSVPLKCNWCLTRNTRSVHLLTVKQYSKSSRASPVCKRQHLHLYSTLFFVFVLFYRTCLTSGQ